MNRLVAVGAFGEGKALFPTGFVKFFGEYARFRLQNLPCQSKKWQSPSLKALHRDKSNAVQPSCLPPPQALSCGLFRLLTMG
ncbi:MAG: hypothetical protein KIS77_06640 [Saprospiraceae bacterium]|nr:hypothetical protein [Saprospiraceae bacterium]